MKAIKKHKNLYMDLVNIDHTLRKQINIDRINSIIKIIKKRTNKDIHNCLVLEYGCNTGFAISELARKGNECIGVDVSRELIEFAINNNEKKENLGFIYISNKLPFSDNTFDFVFAIGVLECMPLKDQDNYLKEFRKVIRKDGLGCISYSNLLFPISHHSKIPFFYWIKYLFAKNELTSATYPSKIHFRKALHKYNFDYIDISEDLLNSDYVKRRFSRLKVLIAKLLSKTPFAAQDYLLLFPR